MNSIEFKDIVEDRIGFVFSEDGIYTPDVISFTVELGSKVEIGDIVCIEHPSKPGIPVFYQVEEVPLRRKAKDYEEDLARIGNPLKDESRNYPRAKAKQLGYVEDLDKFLRGETTVDDLTMVIEHIKPLSEVYKPRDLIVKNLFTPSGPSVLLGYVYPNWKYEFRLDLKRVMRQGLLIVGGVGTGKTTTMLSILIRTIQEFKSLGAKPHIVIIDKDGEYGVKELREAVGEDNYVRIDVNMVNRVEFSDKNEYFFKLMKVLGYVDKRKNVVKVLENVVQKMKEEKLYLTPDFVKEKILSVIQKDPNINIADKSDLMRRFEQWKSSYGSKSLSESLTIADVLKLIKSKSVVHIDLSMTRDFDRVYSDLDALLNAIYSEALTNETFGCIIAIDEAHLFAPERGGIALTSNENNERKLRDTLHLLATTGARNGVTLFVATQRPSLISKTITTQMGQNVIAHRVEDVDLERVEEIVGPIARRVRVLPRGWAIVKALAAKIREPLIVKIEPAAKPLSVGRTAFDRFMLKGG